MAEIQATLEVRELLVEEKEQPKEWGSLSGNQM